MFPPIQRFWARFEQGPTIFFVGSAISLFDPSRLPSAQAFTATILRTLRRGTSLAGRETDFTDVQWPRLESVLQELAYCAPDAAISAFDVLKRGRPNAYHRFLAAHLGGQIPRIYTTNQDELIEAALTERGLRAEDDFVVWTPGRGWSPSPRPTLVKLHGTVSDPRSIRTTLRQVSRGLPTDIAEVLATDLRTHQFCVLGYSGNDIDIRPVFHRAAPRALYWLVRAPGGLPSVLAQKGNPIQLMVGDLRTFLPHERLRVEQVVPEEGSTVDEALTSIDAFIRLNVVSRCVGLSVPYDSWLHARCNRVARTRGRGHSQVWRAWYDAGERFHRRAGFIVRNAAAFLCHWQGWRRARRSDPVGQLFCMRGMWMACDLLAYGLTQITYAPGIRWFAPACLRLIPELPPDDRGYWTGLVRLLELRAAFRRGEVDRALTLAAYLIDLIEGGPHLHGHGLRYLARIHALCGRHPEATACLREAEEDFAYMEAATEVRDVHRAATCCAIVRGDAIDAARHLRAAEGDGLHPRERVFNRLLALAVGLARWRFSRRLSLAIAGRI